MMNGGFTMGMIFWWLFLIVVIGVILRLFPGRADSERVEAQAALEILKARYARGEIDSEEFEERRQGML